jgi:hypothetical protein
MESKDISVPIGGKGKPVASGKQGVSIAIGSEPIRFRASASADIVLVIDTTGSMENEIYGLLETSQRFVDELAKKQIDWQIAIVSFGDLNVPGDKILATSFSKKPEVVKKSLRQIPRNDGGANQGESCLEAIVTALNAQGFRQNAIKVFMVMTDEPALQSKQLTAQSVTEKLLERGVLAFLISEPFDYFKEMANRTGGEWFQISSDTDFLSILDRLGKRVSQIVTEVQSLADGNVRRYLQLKSGR